MGIKYEEAVPWGRSFDEYRRMFNLTGEDLRRNILGCADGPASFNEGMLRRGSRMISCDPLYEFTTEQIKQRIDVTYENVMEQARQNQDKFLWNVIKSPDELGHVRMEAMQDFLSGYESGKNDGRYVPAELPRLPFSSSSFDLALCSHFLFFYSNHYSLAFHQEAIDELCRVAAEVRIFPLLTYNAEPCPYVRFIMEWLQQTKRAVSVEIVPYQFQRGGNAMMRLRSTLVGDGVKRL